MRLRLRWAQVVYRAHSSARLERTPDKGEVDGSNPSGPTERFPWSDPVWTLKMRLAQASPLTIRTKSELVTLTFRQWERGGLLSPIIIGLVEELR